MEFLWLGYHYQIMLMYYVTLYAFLDEAEKDWVKLVIEQDNHHWN